MAICLWSMHQKAPIARIWRVLGLTEASICFYRFASFAEPSLPCNLQPVSIESEENSMHCPPFSHNVDQNLESTTMIDGRCFKAQGADSELVQSRDVTRVLYGYSPLWRYANLTRLPRNVGWHSNQCDLLPFQTLLFICRVLHTSTKPFSHSNTFDPQS